MAAKIGILWRDSLDARGKPLPQNSRLYPVQQALAARGMAVETTPYCEEAGADVRAQLLGCNGVLVWADPLDNGRDRRQLDALLREAAAAGVWVSAHPDVILKIGTKEILYSTRHLGWGGDTALYRTLEDFRREFPARLAASGRRVLKRYRGNGGQGVWKVAAEGDNVRLQEATDRDDTASVMKLSAFLEHCASYFEGEDRLIDQAFQPRIADGMVRCYMCGTELVGFARQYPASGIAPDKIFGLPAAKTMLSRDEPQFQGLRARLEREWTPQMLAALGLEERSLPALWDADFLFGEEGGFVLCEINCSCVTPFPAEAPAAIAAAVVRALEAA